MKAGIVRAGGSLGVIAMLIAFAACGGDDGGESDGATTQAAGPCSPVQEIDVPQAENYHKIGSKFTASDYETNPPAGGFHSGGLLGLPTIKPPQDDLGAAVHELNHGAVILWPGGGMSSEDDDALLKTYRTLAAENGLDPGDKYAQLAIIGNPEQEAVFAMTAWGYLQECDSVDVDAVEAFVEEHYASGPEGQNVACGELGLTKPPDVPACRAE